MSSVWSSHACKFEYWVHLNYSKISSTTSPKRLNNTLNQFELPIFEFYTVLVYAFWNPTFRPTQASLRKTWCLPFQAGKEFCRNGFTRYPALPSLYHLASIQHLQRRAINLSEFNTDWNLHLLKRVWFELQAIKMTGGVWCQILKCHFCNFEHVFNKFEDQMCFSVILLFLYNHQDDPRGATHSWFPNRKYLALQIPGDWNATLNLRQAQPSSSKDGPLTTSRQYL